METLCFEGHYTRRFARCREFMPGYIEAELDRRYTEYCNQVVTGRIHDPKRSRTI
jgi:hypothetical protein